MGSRSAVAAALGLAAFALFAARAQVATERRANTETADRTAPAANLRVSANLVLIPVSVCDPLDRPVTGLEKRHFRVFDDSVEQTVTSLSVDDEPVAVGLVFDASGSMNDKLRLARLAASSFLQFANPDDEFFLVEFNDRPRLAVPLTTRYQEIVAKMGLSRAKGGTALVDAVILALHELKNSRKSRKALLIISDGGDNSSRYTVRELKDLVRESDALIYAIGIFAGPGATPEEIAGPALLTSIANQSGGRHYPAQASELPDIAAKIGAELRSRYVLGYSPANQQRDGRYHPVRVKIDPPRGLPQLRASWRRGYYAPQE
jgi:Ca-activated chloride channel homolog